LLVEKNTRSVAYSLGFPMDVKRGDPDYPALLLMQSYFGPHRMSGGRLFQRIREIRGINYGDYAYIEYFPRGMFLMDPSPNLARRGQIFQIWIRPVEPPRLPTLGWRFMSSTSWSGRHRRRISAHRVLASMSTCSSKPKRRAGLCDRQPGLRHPGLQRLSRAPSLS
jgi:hypothetical protein